MEKVIISKDIYYYGRETMEEVNTYLNQGWTVKTMTTVSNKEGSFVVFVLEEN